MLSRKFLVNGCFKLLFLIAETGLSVLAAYTGLSVFAAYISKRSLSQVAIFNFRETGLSFFLHTSPSAKP